MQSIVKKKYIYIYLKLLKIKNEYQRIKINNIIYNNIIYF